MGRVPENVRFAWRYGEIEERAGVYFPEEGDRTSPCSVRYWSRMEVLPPERLEEIRWERLVNLLQFAHKRSPFYRRRWDAAGIDPADIKNWHDFRRLPIITKQDLEEDQGSNPPYGTVPTSPPHTQLKHWQTSGTTGRPRYWSDTREDWDNGVLMQTRGLYAHGVRPGWRAFISFAYPPAMGFWICHEAAELLGCQVVPRGPLTTLNWLRFMQSLAPSGATSMVAGTPTSMIRMIEVARENGIDLRELNVKVLHMAGEPGATVPATKVLLEEAWGAEAHDMLGTTETSGPLFYSCSEQAKMSQMSVHMAVDQFVIELVDPVTLGPVDPDVGEKGVTVVTALSRFGMPAVRYLVGDLVSFSREKCPCGRTLPLVEKGGEARADDMLIIKGVKIYPSLIENSVRAIKTLSPEYRIQVLKTGATVRDARLYVEAVSGVPASEYRALADRLRQDIRAKTLATLEVEVREPGSLRRDETKSRRIIEDGL